MTSTCFSVRALPWRKAETRDPQHNEGLLTPNLNRKIGDAHPRLIEGALSLL